MEKSFMNFSPEELVALAGSLAISLHKKFDCDEICSIKVFLSALQSNLTLVEVHENGCKKRRVK